MSEFERSPQESPQELQARMRTVLGLVPDARTRQEVGLFDEHTPSQLQLIAQSQLEELLNKAPITDSYKDDLKTGFEVRWKYGVDKTGELTDDDFREGIFGEKAVRAMNEGEVEYIAPDESDEYGGIFETERTMELERLAYHRRVSAIFGKYTLLNRLNKVMGGAEDVKPDPNSEEAKGIQKWRTDFFERYSEEP